MALRVSLGKARRLLAATVVTAAIAIVGTLVVAAPAQAAAPFGPVQLAFWHDGQALTVGSAALGSVVVQDTFRKDDPLQIWTFSGDYGTGVGVLVNPTVNACLSSDGVPGHVIFVMTCDGRLGQVWTLRFAGTASTGNPVYSIWNQFSNVVVGVANGSYARRASVISDIDVSFWPEEYLQAYPA